MSNLFISGFLAEKKLVNDQNKGFYKINLKQIFRS